MRECTRAHVSGFATLSVVGCQVGGAAWSRRAKRNQPTNDNAAKRKRANQINLIESKVPTMEMTTDLAVVSRARAGDADAFRQLVERHSKPMFRVAYRMTGNEHDADDVVQETFLRAYRQLRNFEERANFGTWLHRIAVNCSLDLLRARGRADKHSGVDPEAAELA